HLLAPDHGCRAAGAGDFDLPADVLRLAPFDGRIAVGRQPVAVGTAPLGPVAGAVLGEGRKGEEEQNDDRLGHGGSPLRWSLILPTERARSRIQRFRRETWDCPGCRAAGGRNRRPGGGSTDRPG